MKVMSYTISKLQTYVTIVITFISYFISSFHRRINLAVEIRDGEKENPNFERREKNEAIIWRNCLPHHKRASTFANTYKAARLHYLPMLSRYSPMSERVQHDEQCSSLHAEGLTKNRVTYGTDGLKKKLLGRYST